MNQLAEGCTSNLELAGSISLGEFGHMHDALFAGFVGAVRAPCPLDQPHEEAIGFPGENGKFCTVGSLPCSR